MITIFDYPSGFKSLGAMLYVFGISYCIGIPSIALISAAGKSLNRRYPWLHNPLKRLALTIAVEVSIALGIFALVRIIFVIIYKESFDELFKQLSNGFLWALGIAIFGIATANGALFFRNWKQSALKEEILKREKLAIEYEALRNQVNPHFLFNSLTALTTLVHQDPDKAEAFIRKFSDVYRYILENRNQEVVSLQNELHLIKNMAYLYQYRHGKNLQIELDLNPSDNRYVLPMALQMLLENALKHNVISEDRPLQVRIFEEEEYVVVWNNLQLKYNVSDSTKVGLSNILLRYSYLTLIPVEVESSDLFFQVKLPILD